MFEGTQLKVFAVAAAFPDCLAGPRPRGAVADVAQQSWLEVHAPECHPLSMLQLESLLKAWASQKLAEHLCDDSGTSPTLDGRQPCHELPACVLTGSDHREW